jgi:hypothetical protein
VGKDGKEQEVLGSETITNPIGHYRIEANGNRYKVFKDGKQLLTFINNVFDKGNVALISTKDGTSFTIDNFKVVNITQ